MVVLILHCSMQRRPSVGMGKAQDVKSLRHILRKPESERRPPDLQKLSDFFKNIKFFQQLDPEVFWIVIQNVSNLKYHYFHWMKQILKLYFELKLLLLKNWMIVFLVCLWDPVWVLQSHVIRLRARGLSRLWGGRPGARWSCEQ